MKLSPRVSSKRYPSVSSLDAEARTRVVREIFTTAHGRYDLLNRVLSLRRDVGWRRAAIDRMRFARTKRFLDVATGTGDLAIAAALHFPDISVAGLDFARPMLALAERKVGRLGLGRRIELVEGDALALPYPDESFDVAAIAFGMRNIPDKDRALREMARVLAPGGQLMVLEMTFAPHPIFRPLYGLYLTRILPGIAGIFARSPAPYYYLADSILKFPAPDEFDTLMRRAGLVEVAHRGLTFGAAYLHIGRKLSK